MIVVGVRVGRGYEWNGKYACLLGGARRVGKTTIAEEFVRNEYESYMLNDFSIASKEINLL